MAQRLRGGAWKVIGPVALLALLIGCAPAPAATPTAAPQAGAAPTQRIRVAYLKWGLLPPVKARGTLEKELASQGIAIEWVGPFPNFAPLLEAMNAGSADLSRQVATFRRCPDWRGRYPCASSERARRRSRPRPSWCVRTRPFEPWPTWPARR